MPGGQVRVSVWVRVRVRVRVWVWVWVRVWVRVWVSTEQELGNDIGAMWFFGGAIIFCNRSLILWWSSPTGCRLSL